MGFAAENTHWEATRELGMAGGKQLAEARLAANDLDQVLAAQDPPITSPITDQRVPQWVPVHQRIVTLGLERSQHEHELCHLLRAAEQHEVHRHMACSSLAEYADRFLGLRGKQVQERLHCSTRSRAKCLGGLLARGARATRWP